MTNPMQLKQIQHEIEKLKKGSKKHKKHKKHKSIKIFEKLT